MLQHRPILSRLSLSLPDAEVVAYLFLCNNSGVVVQSVAQDIATHALAWLVVKVLKERWEVLKLQHRQNVVVGIHWDL